MTKNATIIILISALSALTFVSACSDESDHKPTAKAERPRTRIEVESVTLSDLRDSITLPGVAKASQSTRLSTSAGGKIDWMGVDVGDRVKKGQLLAKIAADLAKARLAQAQAQLTSAKSQYERLKKLHARDLASLANLQKAEVAMRGAEAAAAMSQIHARDALMVAPHRGYVASRFASAGEQAAPGAPVLEIAELDPIKVTIQVPEKDLPFIQPGLAIQAHADAFPNEVFEGEVSRIGVLGHKFSRTMEVEVVIPNPDTKLRPGMLARIRLTRRIIENIPVVRRDAIIEDDQGRAVFLEEDGQVRRVAIELGPVEGDKVAVTQGLHEGDLLVVTGQRFLTHGEAVKVTAHLNPQTSPVAADQNAANTDIVNQ
ncbi:efflux RND transporter periplasmic adaptor subunit [Myxococcota bacterium]|nr:efflux RND transporter periplasmic adaptor subunit [Myxococcota bacterium]